MIHSINDSVILPTQYHAGMAGGHTMLVGIIIGIYYSVAVALFKMTLRFLCFPLCSVITVFVISAVLPQSHISGILLPLVIPHHPSLNIKIS